MNRKRKQSGFTIIEIIIAIMVLTVGLLALVTTAALVTRMIARGQRSAVASMFASQRAEQLRPAACIPAQRVNGSDTLWRGTNLVAYNTWTFVDEGNLYYRIPVAPVYKTIRDPKRVRTPEMGGSRS